MFAVVVPSSFSVRVCIRVAVRLLQRDGDAGGAPEDAEERIKASADFFAP